MGHICMRTGVPRHLRESHVEERKRQRQPDLSAYGPATTAHEGPKVSHGNRATYPGNQEVRPNITVSEGRSIVSGRGRGVCVEGNCYGWGFRCDHSLMLRACFCYAAAAFAVAAAVASCACTYIGKLLQENEI